MIGLMKKDILLITKSISYIYLIVIIIPIIPIIENPNYLMMIASLIISLLFALQTIQTLSLDETVNWDRTVLALPITIKEQISSKYIISIGLSLISSIIIALIGLITYNIVHTTLLTIFFYVILGFCFGILYNSIIIPAAIKFGAEKCRFVLLIFVLVPIIISFAMQKMNAHYNPESIKLTLSQAMIIMLILVIFLMFISYIISVRIQKKKYKIK
jgi:hypothetical protein